MRLVIYAIAIAFALAVIGLRGFVLWSERQQAIADAERTVADMASMLAERVRRTFEMGDIIVDDAIIGIRTRGGIEAARRDPEELHEFLSAQTARTSLGDYMKVIGADGLPIAFSGHYPVEPVDLGDRDWFRSHLQGDERHIGSAIFSRLDREPLLIYSRRVVDAEGTFTGVVQVAMRPVFLPERARARDLAHRMTFGIWDASGAIVALSDLGRDHYGRPRNATGPFHGIGAARTGVHRVEQADGHHLVALRAAEGWPLFVTADVPLEAVLAGWHRSVVWSTAMVILVLAGLAWLTSVGVRLSRREEVALMRLNELNQELEGALADKEMLLREVHHRVRNNLQVTASLLNMQARRVGDERARAALDDTQDRLRSIALLHETLYRGDAGASIDLAEYFERLGQEVAAAYGAEKRGIRLEIDVEPVRFGLDRAVPLALAVTEVLGNAFKHAFAPEASGNVRIVGRRIADDLIVEVHDDGPGFEPAECPPESLGLRLIDAFVRQLDARYAFDADGGTVFRLTVPLKGEPPPPVTNA